MLAMSNTLTAEQRVDKAAMQILGSDRYAALSGVFIMGTKRVTDTIPTACTDGLNELYGRWMVDQINDAELRYLMIHECKHKMYQHLTTWRWMFEEDAETAGKALDHVINLEIDAENPDGWAVMPKAVPGYHDPRFVGMNSAEVYHILRQEKQDGQGQGKGAPGGEGTGFDVHDWENAKNLDPNTAKQIDEALRQGALMASRTGRGDSALSIENLLAAQVNWPDETRDFVTDRCAGNDYSTWARPNRRFISMGIYMPSGVSERVGELVVAADTSGSVVSFIHYWLSELRGIVESVKPSKLHLLYWGTEVCGHEIYDESNMGNLVQSTAPKGGGGTVVSSVSHYLRESAIKPAAVVVLTDGHIYGNDWGDWNAPVLWCVLNNRNARPPVGKVLHITS